VIGYIVVSIYFNAFFFHCIEGKANLNLVYDTLDLHKRIES